MDDRSTDIFGPVEENNNNSVEEEEGPEEEQEKDEISSIFEEELEVRTINHTMILGARYAKKWGMISTTTT